MEYYLDCEFLEGTQKKRIFGIPYSETKNTIDLISIGIVSGDGREYYSISKDFNLEEAWNRYQVDTVWNDGIGTQEKTYWIRENVLKPIYVELLECEATRVSKAFNLGIVYDTPYKTEFSYKTLKYLINSYGSTNEEIADEIKYFVGNEPQFYAYYCSYDWVVFCWLFGKMINLPNNYPMYCNDIKQILDEKLKTIHIDDGQGNNLKTGRIDWLRTLPHYPRNTNKHHALSDAKFDKNLHNFIKEL